MYEEFYGITGKPFMQTPDPHHVFHSASFEAAAEQLRDGIHERQGLLLLTGATGSGKSVLCRQLVNEFPAEAFRTALIRSPVPDGAAVLRALLRQFGCTFLPKASEQELLDRLELYLLAQSVQGYACVAVFDEAQNLSTEALEAIRTLAGLETEGESLLQILLAGQPHVRARLEEAELDDQVSLHCNLRPLSHGDVERYIYHRLETAGAREGIRFTGRAISRIYQASQGMPRLVDLICDRTLRAGHLARTIEISHQEVGQGLASLQPQQPATAASPARPVLTAQRRHWLLPLVLAGALGVLGAMCSDLGATL